MKLATASKWTRYSDFFSHCLTVQIVKLSVSLMWLCVSMEGRGGDFLAHFFNCTTRTLQVLLSRDAVLRLGHFRAAGLPVTVFRSTGGTMKFCSTQKKHATQSHEREKKREKEKTWSRGLKIRCPVFEKANTFFKKALV